MYFENRYEAGVMLAKHLTEFKQQAVVLCLKDGAVLVAEPIAQSLQIPVLMLLTKDIVLPGGDHAPTVGTVDQAGGYTYNSALSSGEQDEFTSEYHSHIEAEKIQKMHEIHQMISHQGDIDRNYLIGKNIILVSDGLGSAAMVDAAIAYLKPVNHKKIVAAIPFASVPAIDRLHIQTDQIVCLDVKQNYLSTEHYYKDNAVPSREEIQHRLHLFQTFM